MDVSMEEQAIADGCDGRGGYSICKAREYRQVYNCKLNLRDICSCCSSSFEAAPAQSGGGGGGGRGPARRFKCLRCGGADEKPTNFWFKLPEEFPWAA
jgi:hypothetical protein